ncbi:MAG: Rv3654c family TadE-like protein [Actinomycetota bacterium]|nr:pilus assembly protein TadG-related protein [Actinomycetota bacterium]
MTESQRGSAAVLVLAGALVTMVLLLGLGDLGVFLISRNRAQTAADAAALAAAQELLPGSAAEPASQAARFALKNGAKLLSCRCAPGDRQAVVEVSVPVRFSIVKGLGVTEVRAKALAEVEPGGLRARSG